MGVIRYCRNNPKRGTKLRRKSVVDTVSKRSVARSRMSSITSVIHGSSGSDIILAIRERNTRSTVRVAIPIASIRLPSIFRRVLSSGVNCVHVARFANIANRRCRRTFSSLRGRKVRGVVISLHSGPNKLLSSIYSILQGVLPRKLVICARSGSKGERRRGYSNGGRLQVPLTILMGRDDTDTSRVFTNTIRSCNVKAVIKAAACKGNIMRSVHRLSSKDTVGLAITGCCAPGKGGVGGAKVGPSVRISLSADLLGGGGSRVARSRSGRLRRTVGTIRGRG